MQNCGKFDVGKRGGFCTILQSKLSGVDRPIFRVMSLEWYMKFGKWGKVFYNGYKSLDGQNMMSS